jgi:hypothetical protein
MYQTNRGSIQGGSAVTHYSKKIIGIEVPGKKTLREAGVRKLWAIRRPLYPAETEWRWVRIDDKAGYVDEKEENVEKLLKG